MLKTVSSITNAIGALNYKGTWNASTNTPALASGVGTKGDYYVVSVAGSTNLDGISTWYVGDWAAFNGSVWQRLEGGVDDPALSLKSNATTGLMQIAGPAAGTTRVVTIPNANATMARTDAAQTFSGNQTFSNNVSAASVSIGAATPTAGYLFDARGRGRNVSNSNYLWDFISPDSNGSTVQVYADNGNASLVVSGSVVVPFKFFVNGEKLSIDPTGEVYPGADNTQSLGTASKRWSQLYAGTNVINTSDAREKTEVRDLTSAEIAAAKDLSKEIGGFKFLSAVAQKGDSARTHIGMTVQRAIEIMKSHGLNPMIYGFICYDEWEDKFINHEEIAAKEAVFDDSGNLVEAAIEGRDAFIEQVQYAGSRYGFRHDQLLMFIVRGFEARLSALEKE